MLATWLALSSLFIYPVITMNHFIPYIKTIADHICDHLVIENVMFKKYHYLQFNSYCYYLNVLAGSDYVPLNTHLVFSINDVHATISVQLVNDDISEEREKFFGVIESSELAISLLTNRSEVTIKDDEGILFLVMIVAFEKKTFTLGAVITLEKTSYTVSEGEMLVVNALRSVDVTEEINLVVATVDRDATGMWEVCASVNTK